MVFFLRGVSQTDPEVEALREEREEGGLTKSFCIIRSLCSFLNQCQRNLFVLRLHFCQVSTLETAVLAAG